MKEQQIEVLQAAINKFGNGHQMIKAVRDTAKLSKALIEFFQDPSVNTQLNLTEEVADMEIMIAQIKLMVHGSEKAIAEIRDAKVEKLRRRLMSEVSPVIS